MKKLASATHKANNAKRVYPLPHFSAPRRVPKAERVEERPRLQRTTKKTLRRKAGWRGGLRGTISRVLPPPGSITTGQQARPSENQCAHALIEIAACTHNALQFRQCYSASHHDWRGRRRRPATTAAYINRAKYYFVPWGRQSNCIADYCRRGPDKNRPPNVPDPLPKWPRFF